MPLLDHYHLPLSRTHPWRAFHGAWAAAMARLLNAGVLPSGYYAVPFLDRDGPIEIDVATLHSSEPTGTDSEPNGTQPWNPGEPQLSVTVEWPTADEVRVEVLTDDGDPQLAAAIELVSPRNKDRAKAREMFAAKCAEHLRHGCGVVVVDVVTTRHANMHTEILTMLEVEADANSTTPSGLAAVSYRSLGRETTGQLQAWPFALEVGKVLPSVPLWLNGEIPVRLDLEASHSAACVDLRIRQGVLRIASGDE
jgi:hypothetical protein